MFLDSLKKIGRLEPFEIKNNSLVLCLISPGVYVYSLLIFRYNVNALEIPYLREVFAVLFMLVALLPLTKHRVVVDYYGIFVFIILLLFQHYLTYTVALNSFSIDYLLGTFIVMFGGVLMLSSRLLIVLFSASQLIHMSYWVLKSNLGIVEEGAIIISTTTIFVYSFIILNGIIRYRQELVELNESLEGKIKERTEALERRAKELSARNKDLEEFAYVVSHDLKQPLGNIYTLAEWSEVILKENENEELNSSITGIKELAEQMEKLIKGILNYSLYKKKEKELTRVDVGFMLRKIKSSNETDSCQIIIKDEMPKIFFNEEQLIQVFQNLIENGIVHNNSSDIKIEVACKEEGDEYVFSIKDNGPGIEKKFFDKIFELFQRLDIDSGGGEIGVGLPLVKKIVERSGGKIWLTSKVGVGSTFYFTIRKSFV
ncbi:MULTISPECIES: sensor histidine kinase [unclassified Tenacibaculum]|uniref:sensor histidine kinase n=1 Tax=unclassified Tenacibaculum TaxID=2635139 RepID=UPI001F2E57B0|nr:MULTISPECIES: ATP-binding protein [unclassified Tenacibaculum]MCF2875252.1 ATP-binding protein [Tenacibaculum sp. Cn5-1]MCF2935328.1 ATP-binding protein [Tenacibaculum sp. Cn5-34]MCG7511888.1 ATP-binding protein [Tenacibaculum sp. Cn5-46]